MNETEFTRRDHNATSYSTETAQCEDFFIWSLYAEIITLRAIALKQPDISLS